MGRNRVVVGVGVAVALGVFGAFGAGRAADAGGRAKADPVVELGRRLFFDPAVSRSSDNSCASCHDPEHGFSSPSRLDVDDFSMTKRHSQSLVDAAFGKRFHWDGEFDSVADLVTARLGSPAGARAKHGGAARGEALAATGRTATPVTPPTPKAPATPAAAEAPPADEMPPAEGAPSPVEEPPPPADDAAEPTAPAAPAPQNVNPCAPVRRPVGAIDPGLRTPSDPEGTPKAGEATTEAPKDGAPEGEGSEPAAATTSETPSTSPTPATDGATPATPPAPVSPYGAPPATASASADGTAGDTAAEPTTGDDAGVPPTPDEAQASGASDGSETTSTAAPAAAPEATPTATPSAAPTGSGAWAPATAAPDTSASSSESGASGGAAKDQPTSSTKGEDRASMVAERVEKDGRYAEAFEAAFGSRQVTTARIAEAVAAYVASIRSGDSPYDRFAAGEAKALDTSAQRGLALFRGRAGCAQCHALGGAGARPTFTDDGYHNTGVSARSAARFVTTPLRGPSVAAYDLGRATLTRSPRDVGAFKTPSLREVAARGPYMHDGSFRTLEAVVRHYARGGFADPRLDPRVRPFAADDRDVADLVAFLRALSSDEAPGLAPDFGRRAATTSLRFVDRKGRALAGLPVSVEPAGDRLPGDLPLTARSYRLVTDADGRIAFAPARRTHMRLAFPLGVEVAQGGWVPDTCRDATLVADTAGCATLLLALPAATPTLRALPAFREAKALTDEQRASLARHAPGTLAALRSKAATFALEGTVELAGRLYAKYDAWVDGEGSADGVVDVPLKDRRATVRVSLAPGRETRVDLPR
ncbi:MAG: c-type cytochrome [Planctomycetia bacterium]|nr:c-type cytochrome [Planctomycetia bacterium]